MQKVLNFINDNRRSFLFAFIFMFIFSTHFALDPDMYWHAKTGEWILENGLPQKDTFSYWGGNFVAHEWLFDIFLHLIYSTIGYIGTHAILFLSIGLITFISVYLAEKENKNCWILYLIPLYMLYVHAGIVVPRPHMVSTIAIMLEILILEKSNHKNLWLLPIFTLIVTNAHGASVFILMVIAAVYLLDYIFCNSSNLDKKIIIKYLIIIALMGFTLFATPYGIESIMYGSKLPEASFEYIHEWHPIIQSSKDIPYLFLMLLPLACMAYTKKTRLKDIMILCMGMMLTFIWLRMIIIYVFVYIAFGVKYIYATILDALEKFKIKLPQIDTMKFPLCHIFSVLFCGLFIIAVGTISLETKEASSVVAPTIIKEYIKENDLDVENNVMFNHYNFGGYFIYHDIKVFIDGRNDVYLKEFGSPDVFPDYVDIIDLKSNADELIEKYDIKYFAIYKGYDFYNYLMSKGAIELVSDDKYALLKYPD